MKKAKIMLMVITVFAVVGGALAFNLKKVGSFTYCYTTTNELPTQEVAGICPSIANNSLVDPPTPAGFYTTVEEGTNCALITKCSTPGIPDAN